jgi:hypothetical protein
MHRGQALGAFSSFAPLREMYPPQPASITLNPQIPQIRPLTSICGYFQAFIQEIHKKTFKILAHSVAAPYLCNPNQKIGF